MNTTTFNFNCSVCDFHTDIKSNYTAHIKSKKHLFKISGDIKYHCKVCNYTAKQKGGLDKHFLTKKCIDNHANKIIQERPINLINKLYTNKKKLQDQQDIISNKIDAIKNSNVLLYNLLSCKKQTNMTASSDYDDLNDEWDLKDDEINIIDKKLNIYRKKFKRFFQPSIKNLINNFKNNANSIY